MRRRAAKSPQSPAIADVEGGATSYSDLLRLIDTRKADLRRSGVTGSDRVAIVLPNGPHMAGTFLSVACAATAAPLNPALTKAQFEFYLDDLEAKALVVEAGTTSPSAEAAKNLGIPILALCPDPSSPAAFTLDSVAGEPVDVAPPSDCDVALVLHTSGTTGRPKIVPLRHGNLSASAHNVARTLRLAAADTCLNVMPLFHIHGLVAALLASLASGGTTACTPGFRAPSFFGWLEATKATWYTAVPTMHQAVLERARSGEWTPASGDLRMARSSSASLAPSTLTQLEEHLGVPVVEAYGMTEAAHQMASNPLPPLVRKPGSVGPAAGPEVAISDEHRSLVESGAVGEVVIRGDNVTTGYHGLADQTPYFSDAGWFRTGDQGYLDADGYLFLTGRLKEIINRGGETIAPRVVDEAMLEVDGVRQAVTFAIPDRALGEEVGAAVVLASGSNLTAETLQDRLADVLNVALVPKRIVFVDEIPKGPTGKLQRIGLAERLGVTSVRTNTADAGSEVTETEARVRDAWKAVLQLDDVRSDYPFLEAGGDSITATALAVAIEEEFEIELPLLAFYNAATIRDQAALIDRLYAEGVPG